MHAIVIYEIFIVIPYEKWKQNGQSSVQQQLCVFIGISFFICSKGRMTNSFANPGVLSFTLIILFYRNLKMDVA